MERKPMPMSDPALDWERWQAYKAYQLACTHGDSHECKMMLLRVWLELEDEALARLREDAA